MPQFLTRTVVYLPSIYHSAICGNLADSLCTSAYAALQCIKVGQSNFETKRRSALGTQTGQEQLRWAPQSLCAVHCTHYGDASQWGT